jgi:hypothetical protein
MALAQEAQVPRADTDAVDLDKPPQRVPAHLLAVGPLATLYPMTNYVIGQKEPKHEKDTSVRDRLQRQAEVRCAAPRPTARPPRRASQILDCRAMYARGCLLRSEVLIAACGADSSTSATACAARSRAS